MNNEEKHCGRRLKEKTPYLRYLKRITFEQKIYQMKFFSTEEERKNVLLYLLHSEFGNIFLIDFEREYSIGMKKIIPNCSEDYIILYHILREYFMKNHTSSALKNDIIKRRGEEVWLKSIHEICERRIYFNDSRGYESFVSTL